MYNENIRAFPLVRVILLIHSLTILGVRTTMVIKTKPYYLEVIDVVIRIVLKYLP